MRYLMRGGFEMTHCNTIREIMRYDMIGGNTGNVLYQHSVARQLTTGTESPDVTFYRLTFTDEEIDYINSTYDAFIIPLADAFRKTYIKKLKKWTALIRRLNIPCIVTGVGLRAKYEPGKELTFEFDDEVRDFVKAVLDHSEMLGLRGEITAEYLKKLGFLPEKDYTVIGCPSLFTFGTALPGLKHVDRVESLALGTNFFATDEVNGFLRRMFQAVDRRMIFQQEFSEFIRLYAGEKNILPYGKGVGVFPKKEYDTIRRNHEVAFFMNLKPWIDELSRFDMSLSTRFHGTVAGILAGIPSVIIPTDSRTRELCTYHGLPTILHEELSRIQTPDDVLKKVDLNAVYLKHKRNFDHYLNFLRRNKIFTIFEEKLDWPAGTARLDQMIPTVYHQEPVYASCNPATAFLHQARAAVLVCERKIDWKPREIMH